MGPEPTAPDVPKTPSSTNGEAEWECEVVLTAAVPELYQRNTFRIFGIGVEATTRELARQANRVKQLTELGVPLETGKGLLPVNPAPNLEELRAALHRFQDAEERLVDEFFWFWPAEFDSPTTDAAGKALLSGDIAAAVNLWTEAEQRSGCSSVATHNLAIYWHLRALDYERILPDQSTPRITREEVDSCWSQAQSRWERLLIDELLWERFQARIRRLREPRLTSGFGYRFRRTLPRALALIHGHLALRYANARRDDLARIHAGYLQGWPSNPIEARRTADRLLKTAQHHLLESSRHAERSGAAEPAEGDRYADELLNLALRLLPSFQLLGVERTSHDLFNGIAETCYRLVVRHFETTQDGPRAIQSLRKMLDLVTSTSLEERVAKDLEFLTARYVATQNVDDTPRPSASRFAWEQTEEAILRRHFGESRLESILRRLEELAESPVPEQALRLIENTLVAKLLCAVSELPSDQESSRILTSAAFRILRTLSLRAARHSDFATALKANQLAYRFAHSPEDLNLLSRDTNRFSRHVPESPHAPEDSPTSSWTSRRQADKDVLAERMVRVRNRYFHGATLDQAIDELNLLRHTNEWPSTRLNTFRSQWLDRLQAALKDLEYVPELRDRLADATVSLLRTLSTQAIRQESDPDVAHQALQLALLFAVTPESKRRIEEDLNRLGTPLNQPRPISAATTFSVGLLVLLVILVMWASQSRKADPIPGWGPSPQPTQ